MRLSELKDGESAKVISVDTEVDLKKRLNQMGMVKGVKVTVIKRAPLGCPIEIKLRDFYIALREEDCENIKVEK